MVTKWIQFTVAPENAAAFDEQLARLAAASKTEAGCAHYAAFRSTDPENVFTVLESWDSAESFEPHRVAAHTAEFKKRCGGR